MPFEVVIWSVHSMKLVKQSGFLSWKSEKEYMNTMRLLGGSLEVTENFFTIFERMVCHLYGITEESDINNTRYKKLCRATTLKPR